MLKLLLKKAAIDPNKLVAKKPDENFVPYVCHFDPNTIITKNGELLQIIRITGFSNNSAAKELISLRESVRDAVVDNVKDNKVAFWFNTIRRKKDISPRGNFKDFFSQQVNQAWIKENKWDDQFVNELYITIIVEGLDTSIVNLNAFMRSFSYMTTRTLHHKFLQEAHKKLTQLAAKVVAQTEEYGAKLLGIAEWDGILYSEPMRFFGKIVNLYEERYPLSANDISDDLTSHKIAFGDRELEVVGYKNKNFAVMMSLKEYFEVSTNQLERILQLPFEFIITQSFDFTFSKKEIEPYEYQNYILKVSGDEDFRQLSGVAHFIENKQGLDTDYGKLQTTIMLISSTREELEKDLKASFEQFNSLGFVVIREDIFLEHCFWSQLPGNFRYLRRQKVINTNRIAGFAALHNFPSGLIAGNKWGPAATVFKTVLNTPYFFNFHDGDLGHSLIMGPAGSGKTVLLNFLVTQARRFDGKLFYFDFNNAAKCLIKALGGDYYTIAHDALEADNFLKMNPLSLVKDSENQNFLNEFFASLTAFAKDGISDDEMELIPQIVDRIFTSHADSFTLATEAFNTSETANIYEKLQIWNDERLGHIFGASEEINWSSPIMAFDLDEIFAQKPILIPTVNYLLYRIEKELDGSPTIIVMNEAWHMIDNLTIGPKIGDFLERMKSKNCIVIFTSENDDSIGESEFVAEVKKHLATEIFMPNPNPQAYYKKLFGLNDEEMEILRMMRDNEKHFLFKHADDSVIATLDLSKNVEFLKIFSADEVTLTAMDEVIAVSASESDPNPKPEVWLPQLFEVLQEFEKERVAEEKKRIREEHAEQRRLLKIKLELV